MQVQPAELYVLEGNAVAVALPAGAAATAASPEPPVMVTVAQFMLNSCSRLNHVLELPSATRRR